MIVTVLLIALERVNINDGQGRIAFLGDLDLAYRPLVVNQLVRAEQLLPACFPALAMESPKHSAKPTSTRIRWFTLRG